MCNLLIAPNAFRPGLITITRLRCSAKNNSP